MSGGGGSGANYGQAVAEVGAAVGDLYTAAGARQAAKMYDKAASEAFANEDIEKGSLIMQTAQANRQLEMVQGSQYAQLSAAGFTGSEDLAFATKEQGGVNLQAIKSNNIIQQKAYQGQGEADQSMASQERTKAAGADVGAVFSGLSAVASLL